MDKAPHLWALLLQRHVSAPTQCPTFHSEAQDKWIDTTFKEEGCTLKTLVHRVLKASQTPVHSVP